MNYEQLGHTCVVGLGWGDEGKGKIVDLLSEHFDVIVRYNGGANAGHTVCHTGRTYTFHALPSGILRPDRVSVIGPGVALDLPAALKEILALRDSGIPVDENLRISDRAHLVLPYHKLEDHLSEARLKSDRRIGTTARGIGPCYADKMNRTTAVRMADLYCPDHLREHIRSIVERKRAVFQALYPDDGNLDAEAITDEFLGFAEQLRPHVCDTAALLRDAAASGRRILYEGANGTLLDVDHGTYPFVTSSSASALGVHPGAGVPPRLVNTCIGVLKAYSTRVGQGPFPAELCNEIGDRIRAQGREFGTTTGRPRRCGWFDAVAARYAVDLNGATYLALMHLDTLTGLNEVGLCLTYEDANGHAASFPARAEQLYACRPQIEFLPGWDADLSAVRSRDELPANARNFLARLEELLDVPIGIISVGPQREQTIML
ncbi:MAG: adenylosuccinate synthase [Phycisphaerales bacterium]|nr:MAG: adenylosuccinate synthase [Phycisphaerales bacterium]